MQSRVLTAAAFGVAMSTLLMASSAQAATCAGASASVYTTGGFSCTYDTSTGPLTFSNFIINTVGDVVVGNLTPFTTIINGVTEYGLSLNYLATAHSGNGGGADLAWSYNVSTVGTGVSIIDAYVNLNSTVTGTGTATVTETLSNGVVITVSNPPASPSFVVANFDPVTFLHVTKDQTDFTGTDGSSTSSILENGFSLTTVTPLPAAVWMFGSVLAGAGGVASWRRKRKAA